eukprot:8109005-Pyramimonas_sp.AAC.1
MAYDNLNNRRGDYSMVCHVYLQDVGVSVCPCLHIISRAFVIPIRPRPSSFPFSFALFAPPVPSLRPRSRGPRWTSCRRSPPARGSRLAFRAFGPQGAAAPPPAPLAAEDREEGKRGWRAEERTCRAGRR